MQEPSVFFAEFAREVTLVKADGSFSSSVEAIVENASVRDEGERAAIRVDEPQITLQTSDAADFGEGDRVQDGDRSMIILDRVDDEGVTYLALEPA